MRLYLKDRLVQQMLNLPHNTVVNTSLRWRDDKKRKVLYALKTLGYFDQLSRFSYVRNQRAATEKPIITVTVKGEHIKFQS